MRDFVYGLALLAIGIFLLMLWVAFIAESIGGGWP